MTTVIKNFTFLAAVIILAAACSGNKKYAPSIQDPIKEQVLEDIGKMRNSGEYILQPGDLVDIRVYMEDNMNSVLRVASNGMVTLPLIGSRVIGGKTVTQAEGDIAAALKTYFKNPQVSVFIKEYGNKTVYVLGQVKKPSSIEMPPEKHLTLLEAVTSSGGFTDVAAPSRVRVLRMEDGKQKNIDVDVTQITKHGNKALDILLMPGDVVFVPQSMF